jgi:hypothetical protein
VLTIPVFGSENTSAHATRVPQPAAKICNATREQIEYGDIKFYPRRHARIEFSRVPRTQPQWQNVTSKSRGEKLGELVRFEGVNPRSSGLNSGVLGTNFNKQRRVSVNCQAVNRSFLRGVHRQDHIGSGEKSLCFPLPLPSNLLSIYDSMKRLVSAWATLLVLLGLGMCSMITYRVGETSI